MQGFDLAGYHLRGLFEGLRALGMDVDHLLDECQVDRALLADPEVRFPAAQVLTLWLRAKERYAKGSFGFDLARSIPFGKLELIDYLVAGCPTVGAGIECLAHHARLCSSGFTFSIEDHVQDRQPGRRILPDRLHPAGELPNSMSEYNWTLIVSRFRQAAGAAFQPVLWLRAKPSVPASELLEAFGRMPLIAEQDALFISDAQWNLPNTRQDPTLHRLLLAHAQDVAARLPKSDFLSTLQGAIVSAMHRGDPSIGRIATRLGFTPRTLQRRLEDEGLTFQRVLEDLRQDLARQYLLGSQLSITEISGLLAYTDATAFGRAFRRWTGRTPVEFRKSARREAPAAQLETVKD
jgi:AraC-like DNA-binding protein